MTSTLHSRYLLPDTCLLMLTSGLLFPGIGHIMQAPTIAQVDGLPPPAGLMWNIRYVDDKMFNLSTEGLQIDANGWPHIAYGGHQLYYARYDGTAWRQETVDSAIGAGSYAALALDHVGHPHIIYTCQGSVKYAHWIGYTWQVVTVVNSASVRGRVSLALDTDDNPHISYTEGGIKYAYWTGSDWIIQTIGQGVDHSLALDAAGNPHIVYNDFHVDYPGYIEYWLNYARWDGNAWQIETINRESTDSLSIVVDSPGIPHIAYSTGGSVKYGVRASGSWFLETVGIGYNCSLALGSGQVPYISYTYLNYVVNHWELAFGYRSGDSWFTQLVDSEGGPSSLAVDAVGIPHVAYLTWEHQDLKYACQTTSGWDIHWVDGSAGLGGQVSLALDSTDLPHVSYDDSNHKVLKYAHWTGDAWVIHSVDTGVSDGEQTPALAIDRSNNPHIVYRDGTYSHLKYARMTDRARAIWVIDVVSPHDVVNPHNAVSLALDSNAHPHITYYRVEDETHDQLRYAHWTGNAWVIESISEGYAGCCASLALDAKDIPHTSYMNSDRILKYAYWTGVTWMAQTVEKGLWSSLALDNRGYPQISYFREGDLRLARWTGSSWLTQTIDNVGVWGPKPSLSLDVDGNPRISYYDYADQNLNHACWTGTSWFTQTVDEFGDVGSSSSLAIDTRGNSHIAYPGVDYHFGGGGSIKYAVGRLPSGYTFVPNYSGTAEPSQQIVYVHTLRNTDAVSDTFNLSYTTTRGWSIASLEAENGIAMLPGSVVLASDHAATITVTVNVPGDTGVLGMVDTTVITATSTISPTLVRSVTDTTLVPTSRMYLPAVMYNALFW